MSTVNVLVIAIAAVAIVAIFGNTMIHLMVNVDSGDAPMVIMAIITVFGTIGASVTGIKVGEGIGERRAQRRHGQQTGEAAQDERKEPGTRTDGGGEEAPAE